MRNEAQPFSLSTLILFEVLLFVPLLFRPSRYRGLVFFPLLFALYYRIINSTTGSAPSDWSLALAITPQLFKVLDVLVLTNAEKELRRVDALEKNPEAFGAWRKLCWAVELINTPRGVGWNWEVPYICYVGTASRGTYIRSRLPRAVFYYLLLDLLEHSSPTLSGDPIPTTHPFSAAALVPTWSFAVGAYLQLWLVHTVPALMIVCAGLGAPSSFPYVMGPIGFMDSLRCFWGRTWHQAARRQISSLGLWPRGRMAVASPGSLGSAYIQLCTGFAVGGATHAIAGWMAGNRIGWRDPTGAAVFFSLQLLGVMLEDAVFETLLATGAVQNDWRRGHMNDGKEKYGTMDGRWRLDSPPRASRYFLIVVWLSMTMPAYVEGLRKVGILESRLVPFSTVDWVMKASVRRA